MNVALHLEVPAELIACAQLWWQQHQSEQQQQQQQDTCACAPPLRAYLHAASPAPLLRLYSVLWAVCAPLEPAAAPEAAAFTAQTTGARGRPVAAAAP